MPEKMNSLGTGSDVIIILTFPNTSCLEQLDSSRRDVLKI